MTPFPSRLDVITAGWADEERSIRADRSFEADHLKAFAYAPAFIFARAANLGQLLAAGGGSIETVQKAGGVDEPTALSLLALLREMNLVERDTTTVDLTPLGRRLLDRSAARETFEPIEAFFKSVLDGLLRQATKLGLPEPMVWPPTDIDSSTTFEPMMTVTANYVAAFLDEVLPCSRASSLLDVGGGDGSVAALLCEKHRRLRATVVNLPSARPLVERTRERLDGGSRISFASLDFRRDSLPRDFDIVVFARMLSDWDDVTVLRLLREARTSLAEPHHGIWAAESSVAVHASADEAETEEHPWAWFWRLCVPGFRLHGPRSLEHWSSLAAQAGLGVHVVGCCGREPFRALPALAFRVCEEERAAGRFGCCATP